MARLSNSGILPCSERTGPRALLTRVEITDGDQNAVIAVQDDGPGFTEESATRAFHRFFRGPVESNSSEGAGLGLALVLRIAQLHSGNVAIGRGTYGRARVTVTLRCLAAQNQESCHQAVPGDTIALVGHTHCDSCGH